MIRRVHRWLSIAFTLLVAANFVTLAFGSQLVWLGLLTLVPLFGLMGTGLWMFARPYLRQRRA